MDSAYFLETLAGNFMDVVQYNEDNRGFEVREREMQRQILSIACLRQIYLFIFWWCSNIVSDGGKHNVLQMILIQISFVINYKNTLLPLWILRF